jgi:hypothetical protein
MADLNDREDYPTNIPNPTPRTTNPEVAGNNQVRHNPNSYQDGYVQGRAVEQHRGAVNQEIRDNDNAGRGLLVGIILTSLIGLTAGGLYLLNQRDRTPATVERTIVVPKAAPAPSQSPQVRERVIERERIVPVPQQPQPAALPNVNVTVPAPAASATPAQSNPQTVTPNNSSQPSPSSGNTTNNAEPNSSDTNSGSNSGSAGTSSN